MCFLTATQAKKSRLHYMGSRVFDIVQFSASSRLFSRDKRYTLPFSEKTATVDHFMASLKIIVSSPMPLGSWSVI